MQPFSASQDLHSEFLAAVIGSYGLLGGPVGADPRQPEDVAEAAGGVVTDRL